MNPPAVSDEAVRFVNDLRKNLGKRDSDMLSSFSDREHTTTWPLYSFKK